MSLSVSTDTGVIVTDVTLHVVQAENSSSLIVVSPLVFLLGAATQFELDHLRREKTNCCSVHTMVSAACRWQMVIKITIENIPCENKLNVDDRDVSN